MDTHRRNRKMSKIPDNTSISKSENDADINDENVLKSPSVENLEENISLEQPSSSTKNDIEDHSSFDPESVDDIQPKSDSEAND